MPTGQQRETAILDATEALLTEGASFATLKVEDIARRAGLGRTNFYFYFSDKQQLLKRLASGAADELYAEADHWWHGDGDGAEELARIIEPIVSLWIRHRAVLAAVVQSASVDDEMRDLWRALVDRFVLATRARIEREQAAGRALDVPPEQTAFCLVWMTERACYQHVQQAAARPDELARALTAIWLRTVYGGE